MKLLHFGDVHIGVETHGRTDAATGLNTRLLDFERCLKFVIDKGLERCVDAVLFAGDAYDHSNPTPTHQKLFATQIRRLSEANIPTVMVVGNHDMPVAFGRATALELFGVLGVPQVHVAAKPQVLTLTTRSGPLQVVCLPYPNRSSLLSKEEYRTLKEEEVTSKMEEIMNDWLRIAAQGLDPSVPAVLLAHVPAAEATYSGSERSAMLGREPVLLTSSLANPAFHYVALGHIHKFQDLNPHGSPHVVYSGSIERIDFGEEKEEKGFCFITITVNEGGGTRNNGQVMAEFEFVPTPARRFVTIEVDARKADDPTAAILRAIDAIDTNIDIKRQNLTGAIVRVSYQVSDEQQSSINLAALHAALERAEKVAGIVRKTELSRSQPRAHITEHMGMEEALHRYIQQRPELQELEQDLIQGARALEDELRGAKDNS